MDNDLVNDIAAWAKETVANWPTDPFQSALHILRKWPGATPAELQEGLRLALIDKEAAAGRLNAAAASILNT